MIINEQLTKHKELDNAVIEDREKVLGIDPILLKNPVSSTEKEIIKGLEDRARRSESKAVTIQANI